MKALHDRPQRMQNQRVVADVAARIAVIFDQYPMLCGFSVQQCSTLAEDPTGIRLPGELCLSDVSVSTWPGFRVTREFYEQIANMLLDLMEEQPAAGDLLPGCTFARTLH